MITNLTNPYITSTIMPSCFGNGQHFLTFTEITEMLMYSQTERDVSVRQRAVDLLYAMCDRSNAEEIVLEMLAYLETADYSIREEMAS